MGTLIPLDRIRPNAPATVVAAPAGCKGPACPAFAMCQGKCGTGRKAR